MDSAASIPKCALIELDTDEENVIVVLSDAAKSLYFYMIIRQTKA
jgi:hypothetical protein